MAALAAGLRSELALLSLRTQVGEDVWAALLTFDLCCRADGHLVDLFTARRVYGASFLLCLGLRQSEVAAAAPDWSHAGRVGGRDKCQSVLRGWRLDTVTCSPVRQSSTL